MCVWRILQTLRSVQHRGCPHNAGQILLLKLQPERDMSLFWKRARSGYGTQLTKGNDAMMSRFTSQWQDRSWWTAGTVSVFNRLVSLIIWTDTNICWVRKTGRWSCDTCMRMELRTMYRSMISIWNPGNSVRCGRLTKIVYLSGILSTKWKLRQKEILRHVVISGAK